MIEESTEWLLLGIGEVPCRIGSKEHFGEQFPLKQGGVTQFMSIPFFEDGQQLFAFFTTLRFPFPSFLQKKTTIHCAESEMGRGCC